jgi:hypothetical protein
MELSKEEYSNIMNLVRSDLNNQHLAVFLLKSKGFSLDEITWFFIDNAELVNFNYTSNANENKTLLPDAIVFQDMMIKTYVYSVDINRNENKRIEIRIPECNNKNWSNLPKLKQKKLFNTIKEYIKEVLQNNK